MPACFVNFKKAFDSVWHEGLFYRILSYGKGGNLYSLIKSLYSKTICSIKINKSKTGALQGCILSPLLFILYVNEQPLSFYQSSQCDPFTLPNGTKLNSLLYADDLLIFSRSKRSLNNCLKKFEAFNSKWLLEVNLKKTKAWCFIKQAKKNKEYIIFY